MKGDTSRMLRVPDGETWMTGSSMMFMDVLGRPQGSYPESFVTIFLFLAEIYGCEKMTKT